MVARMPDPLRPALAREAVAGLHGIGLDLHLRMTVCKTGYVTGLAFSLTIR
jgi:hypothetical protein